MKKTITLLLFAVICIVGTSNAQRAQSTPIDELLNRLEQIGDNHGNISDYFTQEEQIQLRTHLSKKGVTKTFSQNVGTRTISSNSSFTTGNVSGTNAYNGPAGTATREANGDQDQTRMPVVITHSNTQTIEAGAEIACAAADFRDNNMYRAFDLANDFGIAGDFIVTNAEVAIGLGVITPAGFPMTANIWSADSQDVDTATLTLQGTGSTTIMVADSETVVSIAVAATIPAGEIMVVEYVIVDDLTGTNYMRFGCNNDGETGPSWIMAPDCGATVPTRFSDLGLTQGMVANVIGDEATSGGGVALCSMNATVEVGTFDQADGSVVTALGPSASVNFENAGSIDPADANTAYVLDNGGAAFSVNATTGAYTSLGSIPGGWLCGEFDHATGIYYAIADDTNLYTIDFGGLSATLVGSTGLGLAIGLAIDGAGNAYTYDLGDDNLYSINLGTGAATLVGPIGFDANFGQGMFWDAASDTVLMTAFNNGLFDSELRSVDTATGATTLINQMDAGALTQYAWSTAAAVVVPPVTCDVEEDFEAGLPTGWSTVVNTGTCDWANQSSVPTGDPFPSLAMVFDDDLCGSGAPASNVSLLSDVYDTAGATSILLGYDVGFQESGTQTFTVEVWDGAAWQQIALYDEDLDPDIQTESGIDATAFANADFQVRWTYDDNGGEWGWYAGVDNFCLSHDGGSTGPSNDECVDAIAVNCGDTVVGETNTATDSGSNPAADVWYTWTSTVAGETVNLSFCDGGTDYDSLVRVFDACGGTELISNDDFCGLQSEVEWVADGSSTYYIMVEGFNTATGNFSMAVTCNTAGTDENAIAGFNYYPNPATSTINLSAQSNIETVAIYNILGQKVVDQDVDAINTSINVSNLSVGTYVMKVSVDGQIGTYKVVKK